MQPGKNDVQRADAESGGPGVPWGVGCTLCNKPETIEHVFLNSCDTIFPWDGLQRALKKDFPLDSPGIRFLCAEDGEGVPYDLVFLALHGIWKSRMAVCSSDVDARPARQYFCENVRRIVEVRKAQLCVPYWLPEVKKVLNMPRFQLCYASKRRALEVLPLCVTSLMSKPGNKKKEIARSVATVETRVQILSNHRCAFFIRSVQRKPFS